MYNMIDYIVIHEQCKPLVIKARSYSSAENFSDHRMVIADMELTGLFKIHQTRSKAGSNAPIAPANLENIPNRNAYKSRLRSKVGGDDRIIDDPVKAWASIASNILSAAEETLGHKVSI